MINDIMSEIDHWFPYIANNNIFSKGIVKEFRKKKEVQDVLKNKELMKEVEKRMYEKYPKEKVDIVKGYLNG